MMCDATDKSFSWGLLTGIRPVKLVLKFPQQKLLTPKMPVSSMLGTTVAIIMHDTLTSRAVGGIMTAAADC